MSDKLPRLDAVQSTAIHSIGHSGTDLYVKFPSGHVWKYEGVTEPIYREMKGSCSVGRYFHEFIKPNHPGTTVVT